MALIESVTGTAQWKSGRKTKMANPMRVFFFTEKKQKIERKMWFGQQRVSYVGFVFSFCKWQIIIGSKFLYYIYIYIYIYSISISIYTTYLNKIESTRAFLKAGSFLFQAFLGRRFLAFFPKKKNAFFGGENGNFFPKIKKIGPKYK